MKNIFCTKEQKVTEHKASINADGEFVFTCTTVVVPAELDAKGKVVKQAELCGRFVKLPASTTDFESALAVHEEANKGQVSVEEQEKKLADFLKTTKVEDAEVVEE